MRVPLDSLLVDDELLALVPRPSPAQREALKASLEIEGQLVPILVLPNMTIIDGYTRHELLRELGVSHALVEKVELDRRAALERVLAMNVHRRHLTDWQRAKVAVTFQELVARGAAERKREGQRRGGKAGRGVPKKKMPDDQPVTSRPSAKRTRGVETRDEIAQMFSLPSGKYFDKAKRVLSAALPDEIEALDHARVPLGEVFNAIRKRETARAHRKIASGLTPNDLGGEVLHGDGFKIGPTPGTVSLCILDPPWGIRSKGNFSLRGDSHPASTKDTLPEWDDVDAVEMIQRSLRRIAQLLRDGGSFYVFVASRLVTTAWDAALEAGLHPRNLVYWKRTNPTPQGRRNWSPAIDTILYGTKRSKFVWNLGGDAPNVIDAPILQGPERTAHPAQKPEVVIERLVVASSNPGDLVCDFMAGSGTTGAVCKRLKRAFVLVEKDEGYVAMIRARLGGSEAVAPANKRKADRIANRSM